MNPVATSPNREFSRPEAVEIATIKSMIVPMLRARGARRCKAGRGKKRDEQTLIHIDLNSML